MNPAVVVIAAFGIASLLLLAATQRRLGRLRPRLFWAQVTFSEHQFRSVVERWGSDGLARFRSHFPLDYCSLICYGLFGLSLGLWLQASSASASGVGFAVTWSLPLAAALDAIENVLQQRITVVAPYSLPRLAFIAAGLSSTAKWLLLAAYPILLVAVRPNPSLNTRPSAAGQLARERLTVYAAPRGQAAPPLRAR